MATVWITNLAGHDYRSAERWGELKPVTVGYYISLGSLDRVIFAIGDGLKRSVKDDWLLPSGPLTFNVIAVALWMRMHGNIRLLVFDRKMKPNGGYRPLSATVDHIDHVIKNLVEHTK